VRDVDRFNNAAKLLFALMLAPALFGLPALSQPASSPASAHPQEQQHASDTAQDEPQFIIRMTTREVVIGVVARDPQNHPVSDMKTSDFELFIVRGWPLKSQRPITGFQVVDPALPSIHSNSPSAGFQNATSERCAIGRYSHYEIAFHPLPSDWTGGFHDILITTSRPKVKLSYRTSYYVGETKTLSKSSIPVNMTVDDLLKQAACYHSTTPPSISLAAEPLQPDNAGSLRYQFIVHADSLAFISVSDQARQLQLDVGICTFDADGIPLYFMHSPIERELTALEYQRALVHGFQKQLEFLKQGDPASVRFAVRDRRTGNLGTISLMIANPARLAVANNLKEEAQKLRESQAQEDRKKEATDYHLTASGPIRSFGTILPQPGAMCGDVYELPQGVRTLPDLWNFDSIGTLYAYQLNVRPQNLTPASTIPGVTKSAQWFGIDYYGEFWINTPGDYIFQLFSDDGAKLYIDENLMIDLSGLHLVLDREATVHLGAGRHTLHLPYFQGPMGLALMLLVEPPDGQYRVFDLRDFPAPAAALETRSN
jgi:hypothetical protein